MCWPWRFPSPGCWASPCAQLSSTGGTGLFLLLPEAPADPNQKEAPPTSPAVGHEAALSGAPLENDPPAGLDAGVRQV